jgi:hypothetical protein
MSAPRPTPVDLIFGPLADERFPILREALIREGRSEYDRDGFVLVREVVELLQDLRPDEGLGGAVDEFVAFVHAAYCFWQDGRSVVSVARDTLKPMLTVVRDPRAGVAASNSRSYYLQLPPQRIWGTALEGQPPQPLDGGFVHVQQGRLAMVAVFGLQAGSDGLTVVDARGPRAAKLARPDGSMLFAPVMEGGALAGLYSVTGTEELVELGWRAHGLLGPNGAQPDWQEVALA